MVLIRKTKMLLLLTVVSILSIFRLKSSHDQLSLLNKPSETSPLSVVNRLTATYNFNRDITFSVFLSEHLRDPSRELPFHWYDWVDLSVLNNFINMRRSQKFDCSVVCATTINAKMLEKIQEIFKTKKQQPITPKKRRKARSSGRCTDYCRSDDSVFQPGFRVFRNLFKGNKVVKHYQSSSYLFSEAQNPYHVIFVTPHGNVKIPIQSNSLLKDHSEMNILRSNLYINFISDERKVQTRDYLNEIIHSNIIINSEDAIDLNKNFKIELDHERFTFDGPEYLKRKEMKSFSSIPRAQKKFYESLKNSLNTKEVILPKHFSETLLSRESNNIHAQHNDWRFFSINKENLKDIEKVDILSRMLRTWFQFTLSEGIISILAHGGLLAHSFNGVLFPYDDDLDIQIPYKDFIKLAENFNNTLIFEDLTIENYGNDNNKKRGFYLDITDSITHRTKGNGLNNIDARFIDIDTGLFIDITVLGVSSSYLPERLESDVESIKQSSSDVLYNDPNFIIPDLYDELTDKDKKDLQNSDVYLYRTLRRTQSLLKSPLKSASLGLTPIERYDLNYKLQIYNCRNNHFYQLKDISPLRMSYINGIPILIPNNVENVLSEEYKPQFLLASTYGNWCYLPQIRLWVPKGLMIDFYKKKNLLTPDENNSKDSIEDSFLDQDLNLLTQEDLFEIIKNIAVLKQYVQSNDYSLLHEKEMMILKDETLDDSLIEELLKNRQFIPNYDEIDNMDDLELYSKGKEHIENEYSNLIKLETIGKKPNDDISNEINYNNIGYSLKSLLNLYIEGKYDPDIDLKVVDMNKLLLRKQSESKKAIYAAKLKKLVDKQEQLLESNKINVDILPKLKKVVDYTGFDSQEVKEQEAKEKEEIEAAAQEETDNHLKEAV